MGLGDGKFSSHGVLPSQGKGCAEASLPPSKSILNRLLILAALSSQRVTLEAPGFGEDTACMLANLRALGFDVNVDPPLGTITLQGQGGNIPHAKADLYFENAGTVARFISALIALRPGGVYTLDGSEAMRKRPLSQLWEALEAVGAVSIAYLNQPGCLPATLKTFGLNAKTLSLDASLSSQGLSALMMVGGIKGLEIYWKGTVPSWPFVEMTAGCMRDVGGRIDLRKDRIKIEPSTYHFLESYPVPLDATAASYWACWAISTQRPITLRPFFRDPHQGDWMFLDYLKGWGLIEYAISREGIPALKISPRHSSFPIEAACSSPLEGDFKGISDTFLSLLAIGPLLQRPIALKGLGHTRYQECNRLKAVAQNMQLLGQKVEISDDSLTLWPSYEALKRNTPAMIDDHQDHRIAMSFAVLASHPLRGDLPWLYLKNPSLCAKTFPDFFKTLECINLSP